MKEVAFMQFSAFLLLKKTLTLIQKVPENPGIYRELYTSHVVFLFLFFFKDDTGIA